MSQFPNIVDSVTDKTEFRPEKIGAAPGRRQVRLVTEANPALKSRLDAIAFETGMSSAEIMRYALWCAVLDAEANPKRFAAKVAKERIKQVEQERLR